MFFCVKNGFKIGSSLVFSSKQSKLNLKIKFHFMKNLPFETINKIYGEIANSKATNSEAQWTVQAIFQRLSLLAKSHVLKLLVAEPCEEEPIEDSLYTWINMNRLFYRMSFHLNFNKR